MFFDFSPEQYEVRDSIRGLLGAEFPASRLREIWDTGSHPVGVWERLSELGMSALLVSEQFDGIGATLVDVILPLEECGYAAVAEPVVETAVIAPIILERYADDDRKSVWLPRIAAGEVRVAVALDDTDLVSFGKEADAVLVVRGGEIHLVPADRVTARPIDGMDPSRRLSRCTFDLTPTSLIVADPAAAALLGDLGAAATASLLVGIAERLRRLAQDYVLEREQFGRKLATFQVLKHRLADVAVHTEAARSLAWYAGYSLAQGEPGASLTASRAKAAANTAAGVANYAALQLHGGIGFTWEHDLHMWLQRGRALEQAFGSTDYHRARVGASILSNAVAA